MEDKKKILLHLYGETDAGSELRTLLENDELRQEHQALSEAKFRVDHIRRERPDPQTIERIMEHAAARDSKLKPGFPRADRPAIWRTRQLRRVLIPAISIAAAVVIAVGLGMFDRNPVDSARTTADVAEALQTVPPESLLRTTPIDPTLLTPIGTASNDPRLAWDDSGQLRSMYRRIETMRPTDLLDWGEASVPLEQFPTSGRQDKTGFRRAGVKR